MASVLNLNNEVVKMRKDVKKVKVLTIRKLTRNISKLKSKKGTEELIQKNQRRAQRLLEEIHTIKKLRPDDVTKSALQKEINFEKVCKKPNSTVETRAVARLATHPLLKKKISAIKDAIKEFKEARKLAAEQETEAEETHKPVEAVQIVRTEAEDSKSEDESMDDSPCTTILKETTLVSSNLGDEDSVLSSQDAEKPELLTVPKLSPERRPANDVSEKSATLTVPKLSSERRPGNDVSEKPATLTVPKLSSEKRTTDDDPEKPATLTVPKLSSEKRTTDDAPEKPASPLVPKISSKRKPVEGAPEKTEILAVPKVLAKRKTAALAPKKTASLTVPKISLERKPVEKVPQNQALEDKTEKKTHELKPGSDSSDIEDSDKEDKEYFDDSTEERFCKQSSGFEDSDSDSEDDFFIGKVRHTKKKKSSKFPPKDKPEKERLPVETTKPSPGVMESQKGNPAPKTVKLESVFFSSLSSDMKKRSFMKRENKFPPVRNKTAVLPQVPKFMNKPQFGRSSAVKSQSKPEPALHPSWEASKKRKEQSQIAVFQGKKIVFDD